MTQLPDPAAAEQALAIARHQRQHVADTSREPWWVWVAAFGIIFGIWASLDLGPAVRSLVPLLATVLLLAWTYLPRWSPRIASAIGRGVLGHRSLIPLRTRLAILAVSLVSSTVAFLAGGRIVRVLVDANAPGWTVRYPHTIVGTMVAVFVIGVSMIVDRVVRSRVGRRP